MKTYSFIGSDKNAGKTTAFNFVYQDCLKSGQTVCLTSIGINGELADSYEGHEKPSITVFRDTCFITSCEHLMELNGKYEIMHIFSRVNFGKDYLLGKALFDTELVLEGPNNGADILTIKEVVENTISDTLLLIDGSIDRQFLGAPEISDAFYFSFLITDRSTQLSKAMDLLTSIKLPVAQSKYNFPIKEHKTNATKSLLLDSDGKIIYEGRKIPFMDDKLKDLIKKRREEELVIYINGALTKTFHGFLKIFKKLVIVLDNFTQYQNIHISNTNDKTYNIFILNKVIVKKIFLKEEVENELDLPENIPVQNIFRRAI